MSTDFGTKFAGAEKGYGISVFSHTATANQTRQAEGIFQTRDLDQLSYELLNRPWAPGIFHEGVRNNKSLKSIQLLVLDIDEGCSLEDAIIIFAPFKHIIGTSKSHQQDKGGVVCDRFRVILFLDKPLTTDEEFKEFWFAAYNKWPFIDKACKDSARFFFPCKEIISINEQGAEFTERAVKMPQSGGAKKAAEIFDKTRSNNKGRLSQATKDFIAFGAPDGEWHHTLFKAAADCKEQGYSQEETEHLLAKATGALDDHDLKTIDDVYQNRPSKYAPREVIDIIETQEWPVLGKDKEGPSPQAPKNYLMLFEKWKLNFALNEIDGLVYVNGRYWNEEDRLALWIRCKNVGMHGSQDMMYATIMKLAQSNTFNPMKQLIESAPWDGTDYIGALFNTLTFDDDRQANVETYKKYLTKWTVGIIAKIYNPGSQNLVFTFVGTQGIGKSRWLSKFALWQDAFGEGAVDPNNKDHELRHLINVIWHIPELDYTTGRRETGALKDYLTRDQVAVRPAYARQVRRGRSICSFAASCNTTDFLIDQTGNRRFLIVPVKGLDHNHSVPMQQVFAQARALYEQGYQYWLNETEIAELNAHNEEFALEDQIVVAAYKVKPGFDEMTLLDVMTAYGVEKPNRSDISRFGAVLAKRGITKKRRRIDGRQERFYCVVNPAKTRISHSTGVVLPMVRQGETTPKNEVGSKKPSDIE
jgi:predicted P-loop ATPase